MKISSFPPRLAAKLLSLFSYVFLAVFLVAVVYVGLDPSQHKFKLYEAPIPVFVAAAALVVGVAWLVDQKSAAHKVLSRFYWAFVALGFVGTIMVQIGVAYALKSSGYTWDSNIVFEQAVSYANTGAINPELVSYFAINPNNIPILLILGSFFKAAKAIGINDYLTAAVALNVVVLLITQLTTFLTVKLLYGRMVAAVSMIFSFALITLTMYAQISYTDTLSILFPITMLYLTIHVARTGNPWLKILLSTIIGLLAVVGFLIKPTVIIALVAIGLVAVLGFMADWRSEKLRQRLIVALSCVVCCVAAMGLVYKSYPIVADHLYAVPFSVTKTAETSKPLLHFAAMGLKTVDYGNTVSYGGFNQADADNTVKLQGKQAKTDYSVMLIKQRLNEHGSVGYSKFLAHKTNWILSDGTFYAYGEGSNEAVKFTAQDQISKHVRGFMYVEGKRYVFFSNVLQVFWVALLLLIAVQLIIHIMHKASRANAYAVLPRLMIAGILLFLLLFEGRSRYIFLYLPIFIVAAMYTLQWFRSTAK